MNNLIFMIPFYGAFLYADEKVLEIHPDYLNKRHDFITPYDEFLIKAILIQNCFYFYTPLVMFYLWQVA